MRKMKALTIFVSTLLLCTGFLAGCSTVSPNMPTQGQEKNEADPKELKANLSVVVPQGDYLDFMKKEVLPSFQQQYPGVKVNIQPEPDGGQMDARIAAGDAPHVWVGVFGYQPAKYAKAGKLVKLDELPGADELKERIDETFIHED